MSIVADKHGISFNPSIFTVSSLARCGPAEFESIMEWVTSQRAKREDGRVEIEARAREAAQTELADVAERHAAQTAWAAKNL
jgi:hypothetical protein